LYGKICPLGLDRVDPGEPARHEGRVMLEAVPSHP
jgi:hypothetical protein